MGRQFDVFEHPIAAMRMRYPYVIALQHDRAEATGSVIIAPLAAPLVQRRSRLYPLLEMLGNSLMMLTPDLAAIARRHLARPVTNLAHERERIIAAIDLLFVGS